MVWPRRDVSDLPRPLLLREKARDRRPHRAAHAARALGRGARIPPERTGRDHLQRLFWRRPRGHHGKARLSFLPRRDDALPLSDLRSLHQPPLRHGLLRAHRPPARHGGGLPHALQKSARARHPRAARRRFQPHGAKKRLFQRRRLLSLARRGAGTGFPLLLVVQLPPLPRRLRRMVGHQEPPRRQRNRAELCRLYHRGRQFRHPPLAARGRVRLAAGCRR